MSQEIFKVVQPYENGLCPLLLYYRVFVQPLFQSTKRSPLYMIGLPCIYSLEVVHMKGQCAVI